MKKRNAFCCAAASLAVAMTRTGQLYPPEDYLARAQEETESAEPAVGAAEDLWTEEGGPEIVPVLPDERLLLSETAWDAVEEVAERGAGAAADYCDGTAADYCDGVAAEYVDASAEAVIAGDVIKAEASAETETAEETGSIEETRSAGETGPAEETGPDGETGPAEETGPAGENGPDGEIGADEETGPDGETEPAEQDPETAAQDSPVYHITVRNIRVSPETTSRQYDGTDQVELLYEVEGYTDVPVEEPPDIGVSCEAYLSGRDTGTWEVCYRFSLVGSGLEDHAAELSVEEPEAPLTAQITQS